MTALSQRLVLLGASLCLNACATAPDQFYTLDVLPKDPASTLAPPLVHVLLKVDLPPLIDRAEMVINLSDNRVSILEHQRWAPPLSDQVAQTLARDMERRRSDLLVADRTFDRGKSEPVTLTVDIVRLTAERGGHVRMEAHWRIVDAKVGMDVIGGDSFDNTAGDASFAAIARAYSDVLSALAERLTALVRTR